MNSIRILMRLRRSINDLHFDANRGAYNDEQLGRLRNLISETEKHCSVPGAQISSSSGVTPAVVRSIKGGGRPKLHNFLGVCSALSLIVSDRLIELGALVKVDPLDFDGAEWFRPEKLTSQGEISLLMEALADFSEKFRAQNQISESLSESNRQELIDLLQTAINQLRGPLWELRTLRGIGKRISEAALAIARDGGKEVVRAAAKKAADAIFEVTDE